MSPTCHWRGVHGDRGHDPRGSDAEAGAESFWTVEHILVAENYEPRYPYSLPGHTVPTPGACASCSPPPRPEGTDVDTVASFVARMRGVVDDASG